MSDEKIDDETRLLASVAYGEASTANDSDEIGGIAFAVANRCRAWGGKTVTALKAAEPNYAYAWDGSNARFNKLMKASESVIRKDAGMSLAVDWATSAINNKGVDPSNGGFWWDGLDFKTNYNNHPKVRDGFKFGDPSHNIFKVQEKSERLLFAGRLRTKKPVKLLTVPNVAATTRFGFRQPPMAAPSFGAIRRTTSQQRVGKNTNESKKSGFGCNVVHSVIYSRRSVAGIKWQSIRSTCMETKDRSPRISFMRSCRCMLGGAG